MSSVDDDDKTVYVAKDPVITDPLFATSSFEAISEFVDAGPQNFYDELGVVDAEEAREIIKETYGDSD